MKLSVELFNLSRLFGDFKAVDMALEAGFDAVDYSFYWENEASEMLGDNYREYAEKLRKYLDEKGIECNQAHAPFSVEYDYEAAENKQAYIRIMRSVEAASILGAKCIVVHSISVPKEVDFIEYNIEYYKKFIPYCKKYGICVAVENLFGVDEKRKQIIGKLGSPKELNSIVEKINSPWIVACVDLGHAALTGYEPEEFIDGMNPKILRALHVQDTDYITDLHTLPYTGKLNWEKIMFSLKNAGYEGDITFEIFQYLKKFPNELIQDALNFAEVVGRYLISLYENV